MARPLGKLTIVDPRLARPIEIDTLTCPHCNCIQKLHKLDGSKIEDATGWCFRCGGAICSNCVGKSCTPFEERLERLEAKDRLRRSICE